MSSTPIDPDYEKRVRESFSRQKVMAEFGAVLTEVRPGIVEIQLPFQDKLTQQHGYIHAGIVATICDSAGGYAGYTLMPAGSSVVAVEFKVNFLAPAVGKKLIARGKVIKSGETLTVCKVEAFYMKKGFKKLCAVMQQTLMCLKDKPEIPMSSCSERSL